MSLRELCDRKLREHDHDGVDEEDRADRPLGHAHLALREHGKELEAGHAREDEQRVERDDADERPVP